MQSVTWDDLKVGKPYTVVFRDELHEAPLKGRLQSKTDTEGYIGYSGFSREDVAHLYAPKTKFATSLALLNTKMGADPGVLGTIMRFEKPDFKPNPWKGMTKAQAAVAAAADTKRAEEEALAAMKTGGRKTRRRRRRTTRRRT